METCAYENQDPPFIALEVVCCQVCGSLQEHLGYALFGGHYHVNDVLVWTEPFRCLYCSSIIRDHVLPCLEMYEFPKAC